MTKEKELWKPIEGFEDSYEVSNYGRVRSLDRLKWVQPSLKREGYYRLFKGTVLKPVKSNSTGKGSVIVVLAKNGTKCGHTVGRLVALAFLDNPDNLDVVMHKDENVWNNHVDNLYWTSSSNCQSKRAKESRRAIRCIETNELFESISAAARHLQCSMSSVHNQLSGKHSTCKGRHFEYVDKEAI